MTAFLAALISFLKAIPSLATLGLRLEEWARVRDQRAREKEARERLEAKYADIDASIDGVLHPPAPAGELPETGTKDRFPGGSQSGPGVGPGLTPDDRGPGV